MGGEGEREDEEAEEGKGEDWIGKGLRGSGRS